MDPVPPVTILGVEYPALADGKYDAVILGTGLKECIVKERKLKSFRVFIRRSSFLIVMTTMEVIVLL